MIGPISLSFQCKRSFAGSTIDICRQRHRPIIAMSLSSGQVLEAGSEGPFASQHWISDVLHKMQQTANEVRFFAVDGSQVSCLLEVKE